MKLKFSQNLPLLVSVLILFGIGAIDVPAWVSVFSWFFVLFKIASEKFQLPSLSRRLTTILSGLFLLQVYLEFKTLLGQEPSTSLLMGLAAIKVMDYENSRDHKYLVILGFILLSMKPLFSMDLYWVPFLICAFVGLWWSMLRPEQPKPLPFLGRLFISSIPVALALFFIFPRFVFPWAARANHSRSTMGFSENLNPGNSAELVENDRLIFRARFSAEQPPVHTLYWRGGVLSESHGLSWTTHPPERKQTPSKFIESDRSKRLAYDIFLEPGTSNFIFALEASESVSGADLFIRGYENSLYRLPFPTNKTVLYRGLSDLSAADPTPPTEKDLQTPDLSLKVQAWVDPLKKKSIPERVQELDRFYLNNKFKYTLTPGTYSANDLEEFLFDRREGFCEHFAGSYATLARALGIPARVIVGFQGGTWNEYGNFWRISTKDAHAWVEIYNAGHWQRVDPTGFAAPLRLTMGASQYFQSLRPPQTIFDNIVLLKDQLLAFVETLNYSWTSFLLDFDTDFQKELIALIRRNIGWSILGLVFLGLMIAGSTKILSRRSQGLHPYRLLLLDMIAWGTARGIARNASESPQAYLDRLSRAFPPLSTTLSAFANRYDEFFYQEKPGTSANARATSNSLRKSWNQARRQLR